MWWPQHMGGLGLGGWIAGGLMMLLFWGGLILLAFLAIRAFSNSDGSRPNSQASSQTSGGETAVDIVKRRYAKGEISKEEFEAIRKDLES